MITLRQYKKAYNKRFKIIKSHKHILKQNNILDASELKCKCGLIFIWKPFKFRYEEKR